MRLIDADELTNAIESTDWFHVSLQGNLVLGARSDIHTPLYKADDIYTALKEAPTVDALPLRCRIGDTVWVVGTKCMSGLHDDECPDKNEWDDFCTNCPLDKEYIVFPRTVSNNIFAWIHELDTPGNFRWGETVFKTKEEAEAALAERRTDHGQ